jgi:hypothetical protein
MGGLEDLSEIAGADLFPLKPKRACMRRESGRIYGSKELEIRFELSGSSIADWVLGRTGK